MTNIQYYKGAIDATGCISNGWNLVSANYGMYLGICVIATITMIFLSCIPCLNVLVIGLVNAPLVAGIYFVLLRDMRGEPIDFGMMFKGFEKFVPVMIVGFIQAVPTIIFTILQYAMDLTRLATQILGQQGIGSGRDFYQSSDGTDIAIAGGLMIVYIVIVIAYLIFAITWYISFAFAIPLVTEHNIGAIEALQLSAKAGWGNVGGLIVLAILGGLIGLAGALALCIGIFFVIPIIYAAQAFAYRQVFPSVNAPTTYNTPPPPGEYGGTFGQQYGS
jgi:uncharacterized membrane protein